MIKYRLLKAPINDNLKRLGQTYRNVSRYMTENKDDNWLANRTNSSRSTLVEYKQAEKLAWYFGVNVEDIADEVDGAEYRGNGQNAEEPQEIIIAPQISEEQWERLDRTIYEAVSRALKAE